VPGRLSDLAVISDIDDTIIETGITGGLANVVRNWRRIFAQMPHEREVVPGASDFYSELSGHKQANHAEPQGVDQLAASHRPFFYVSSSPWNLFNYLLNFKHLHNLPLGPLFLRDWGLNRQTLGSASHQGHKSTAIDTIVQMYPNLRFALIGDDTQGDLPAFAQCVRRYPGRIAAVFLRRTAQPPLSAQYETHRKAIEQAGVPLWMGSSFSDGHAFLRSTGFSPGGKTEQIVKLAAKPI